MTLQQLHYFRTMAKVLHYTRASEILYISQPSLSYALSELEKELGVPLFEKSGKKVRLSHFGAFFLDYVERALEVLEEGRLKVRQLSDPDIAGVRLGYIYSLSLSFLPSVTEGFYKTIGNASMPFYFIQDQQKGLIESLKEGLIDLAITAAYDKSTGYAPIFEQELYLITPHDHPLARKKVVHLSDLNGESYVSMQKGASLPVTLARIFKEHGVTPHTVVEAKDCDTTIAYVNLNKGVAIIPIVPALTNTNLAVVKIAGMDLKRTIYLSWIEGKLSPAAQRLKDYILGTYKASGSAA